MTIIRPKILAALVGQHTLVVSSRNRISGSCSQAAVIAKRCLKLPGNLSAGKSRHLDKLELCFCPFDPFAFPATMQTISTGKKFRFSSTDEVFVEELLSYITKLYKPLRM